MKTEKLLPTLQCRCWLAKKCEGDNINANNWTNLQTAMARQLELMTIIRSECQRCASSMVLSGNEESLVTIPSCRAVSPDKLVEIFLPKLDR